METDVCPDADIYRVISASWKLIKDLEEIPKKLWNAVMRTCTRRRRIERDL